MYVYNILHMYITACVFNILLYIVFTNLMCCMKVLQS